MVYLCDKNDIIKIVAEIIKINNLKNPFKDGEPGPDWYYCFMKRHPSLSFKKPEHLQRNRKEAKKPDIIYDFYADLNADVNESGLNSKEKACFVFNTDETPFPTDPKKVNQLVRKVKL